MPVKVNKLPVDRKKMISCDDCGKMFKPSAITEVKLQRHPSNWYLCPNCKRSLGEMLGVMITQKCKGGGQCKCSR